MLQDVLNITLMRMQEAKVDSVETHVCNVNVQVKPN